MFPKHPSTVRTRRPEGQELATIVTAFSTDVLGQEGNLVSEGIIVDR